MSRVIRRRTLLAVLLSLPASGFVRPDSTLIRLNAVFEEFAGSVQMTPSLPHLLRRTDREAMAAIDSGFDTTLEFHMRRQH